MRIPGNDSGVLTAMRQYPNVGALYRGRAMNRALILSLGLLLSGCASGEGLWVELAGSRYTVELADDDSERARWLMFRDAMPATSGMLFVHEREEPLA